MEKARIAIVNGDEETNDLLGRRLDRTEHTTVVKLRYFVEILDWLISNDEDDSVDVVLISPDLGNPILDDKESVVGLLRRCLPDLDAVYGLDELEPTNGADGNPGMHTENIRELITSL